MPFPPLLPIERYPSQFRRIVTFFFPVIEETIRSPQSLEIARHRLRERIQSGLQRTTYPGPFPDHRRYQGQLRKDRLLLRGPFGRRKSALITDGILRADGDGSALELKIQLDPTNALAAFLLAAPLSCFLAMIFSRDAFLLLSVFVPFIAVYAAIRVSMQAEAEILTDLLVKIISREPRK